MNNKIKIEGNKLGLKKNKTKQNIISINSIV